MAQMIPDIDSDRIENIGERIVYRALKEQLPNEWIVRYHYEYCVQTWTTLKDGEADFVVVVPNRGIMFLEIKASFGFESNGGKCWRIKRDRTREECENPFAQACRVKHQIVDSILCPRLYCRKKDFPGIFGHAVVYPRARVLGKLPASQDPQVIWSYRDMRNLVEKIESAFDAWGDPRRGGQFNTLKMTTVIETLMDQSSMVAVAAADTDEDDRVIDRLTRQQYETYNGLLLNNQALIEGKAGSGKTMLAIWTARRLAESSRVLFLCYNNTLAAWLRMVEPEDSNLEIATFHSVCAKYAEQANIPWQPSNPSHSGKFWEESAPTILAEAIDLLPGISRYDAVIIDEGQDFHSHWWIPIEMLLASEKNSKWYIFYDPDQAVQFKEEGTYPSITTLFRLQANCRNSKSITRYCGHVIQKEIPCMEELPIGLEPSLMEPIDSVQHRARHCIQQIKKWIQEGYRASRIAVLSPISEGRSDSTLTHLKRLNVDQLPFEDDLNRLQSWAKDNCIWMSTIKRFKGLEADCLILTDLPTPSQIFPLNELYVAVSRGKHRITLIPSDRTSHGVLTKLL